MDTAILQTGDVTRSELPHGDTIYYVYDSDLTPNVLAQNGDYHHSVGSVAVDYRRKSLCII